MGRIRTVVADDDDEMRSAIIDVLDSTGEFDVVSALSAGTQLPEVVLETRAELVVLDVRMADGGADATRRLRAMAAPPVVVAVSAHTDAATVSDLLHAGASAYLAKGDLSEHFVDDLVRCVRGQVVLAVPHALDVLRHALGEPSTSLARTPDVRR
ncbi:MAG: response regulator transcription factor [Actinomycetota bacterium]|nr:response regulator transcription factor [Actinomycetota bacterium]